MIVMYYLQKQGSTHSPPLSALVQELWHWAIHHNLHPLVEHLLGVDSDLQTCSVGLINKSTSGNSTPKFCTGTSSI